MRKVILVLLMAMMTIVGMAQTLCLEGNVQVDPQNIYASRNPRKDSKGFPCGVLMIHSTVEGLKFSGQMVGDVAYEAGVYYIYLPSDAKKLEASAPSGSLLKITLPKIESKVTYEATLYYQYPKGSISCASDPSGASVTLIAPSERTKLGRTPLKGNVEVIAGTYDIEVSKPGYQTVVKNNVKITAGKTTKLGTIKLKKL